ncbi:MAG: hypothetical protein PVI59_00860 [Anaerolineae bacterium]|jgi:hypothetical protein
MSLKGIQHRIADLLSNWFGLESRRTEERFFAEAGLSDVVQLLRSIEHAQLRSEARVRIWQTALERAEAIPVSPPAPNLRRPAGPQPAWRLRRVALRPAWIAIFLAIAMCFSSFSVTLAAQQTYPNDTLYPVKRLSEDVWFSLAPQSARPRVALELLIRRVEEVEYLAQQQEQIPAPVLDQVDIHLRWIEQAERSTWEEDALERLDYHIRALEELAAQYPENPQLGFALASCQRAYQSVSGQPYAPDASSDQVSPAEAEAESPAAPAPGRVWAGNYDPPQWAREELPVGIEEGPQSSPPPEQGEAGEEGEAISPSEQPPPDEPANDDHVPPGQELTPPGQELTPPGQEDKENTPPGQEHTPPGQERTPPGQRR